MEREWKEVKLFRGRRLPFIGPHGSNCYLTFYVMTGTTTWASGSTTPALPLATNKRRNAHNVLPVLGMVVPLPFKWIKLGGTFQLITTRYQCVYWTLATLGRYQGSTTPGTSTPGEASVVPWQGFQRMCADHMGIGSASYMETIVIPLSTPVLPAKRRNYW
jgi:hypothetical protein